MWLLIWSKWEKPFKYFSENKVLSSVYNKILSCFCTQLLLLLGNGCECYCGVIWLEWLSGSFTFSLKWIWTSITAAYVNHINYCVDTTKGSWVSAIGQNWSILYVCCVFIFANITDACAASLLLHCKVHQSSLPIKVFKLLSLYLVRGWMMTEDNRQLITSKWSWDFSLGDCVLQQQMFASEGVVSVGVETPARKESVPPARVQPKLLRVCIGKWGRIIFHF